VRLAVRLTPRAASDRLDGWSRDEAGRPVLSARVRAAPVEGEANAALEALLAQALFRPRSAVRVIKSLPSGGPRQRRVPGGGSSRIKQVEIDGVEEAALLQAFGGSAP
jgi:uncharacterized protein YggU (UPF0235/DUF167 family)